MVNAYHGVTFAELDHIGNDCTLLDLVDTVIEIELKD